MKTTGFVFAFAMLSGIACYAFLAWLLPELVPDAYVKVVGLVAVAGGGAGWLVGSRRRREAAPAAAAQPAAPRSGT
jgi:hypothetical protein